MRRLFGGHKPKAAKSTDFAEELPKQNIATPLYQKLATHGTNSSVRNSNPSVDEDRWEVVPNDPNHLPNPHPPPQQQLPQQQRASPPPPPPPPLKDAPSRASSFGSLGPAPPPPIIGPVPPRSSSPMSAVTTMSASTKMGRDAYSNGGGGRSKSSKAYPTAPAALNILRSLDPPNSGAVFNPTRSHSEERYAASENGHFPVGEKREKRGFWGGKEKEKEKERDRERERERELQKEREREKDKHANRERDRERGHDGRREVEGQPELTRMIGYLTATAAEDWALVLEVCERASANEVAAKEAVRALRREFKYGEPPAQLSAARLWAIMLRYSSDTFVVQSTSRKFLDTIEDLLSSSRTSPVVRERLLEVVAAAAFASGKRTDSRDGFKGLWKRVKPFDKPEEGVPFDTDDAMFKPPVSGGRLSAAGHNIPVVAYQEPSPIADPTATPNTLRRRRSPRIGNDPNGIIPPDEDIRRLFQECKIGQGNATLLSEALALSKPGDLGKKDSVIKEFYVKCQQSQELIYAQIPWASSCAERSQAAKENERAARKRNISSDFPNSQRKEADESPIEQTMEEKLLAALLAANEDLLGVLRQYEDVERVAMERKAEDRSRKEVRMGRKHEHNLSLDQMGAAFTGRSESSRSDSPPSRSNSPVHTALHTRPPPPVPMQDYDYETNSQQGHGLAPPPAAPHGPRSPVLASLHSRTPSPGLDSLMNVNGNGGYDVQSNNPHAYDDEYEVNVEAEEEDYAAKPSAKALGKRKLVEPDVVAEAVYDAEDAHFSTEKTFMAQGVDPNFDPEGDERWRHPPVHFVYDAVAERTRQRLEGIQLRPESPVVNGVVH